MNDPVQLLIDAGAIPASPFGALSRYAHVEIAVHQPSAAEPGHPYVRRRFVPRKTDVVIQMRHTIHAGDRIDLLAAHYLGDVELHWRIADANLALDMIVLTAEPGRRIAIPSLTGGPA